jgi:hypothetical protein
MVPRECVKINYSPRHMLSLGHYVLPMVQMKFIYCTNQRDNANFSQLGRIEVRNAEKARVANEALKKKQLDLVKSKGLKARL